MNETVEAGEFTLDHPFARNIIYNIFVFACLHKKKKIKLVIFIL